MTVRPMPGHAKRVSHVPGPGLPGDHNSLTMTVSAAKVTFAISDVSGGDPDCQHPHGNHTWPGTYQATSDQWYPAATNPARRLIGIGHVPDLCAGGKLNLAKGRTFTAAFG
jgi:hypothetical protein